MHRVDWDGVTIRSFQRNLNPNQQDVVEYMEDASSVNEEWNTYCKYAGHAVEEAQSSMGVNVGWKELSLPSHNFYINNSEVEDPDGEPLEMDEEDPELARKRKELQVIEERILLKKAAIALKTVEPLLKKTPFSDLSCDESATCFALKDRVYSILQQKHHASFFTKFHSPKERINSSSRSKNGLVQDDHPLKRRVKALMQRRYSYLTVLPESREVPVFTPPPSRQKAASPDNENGANKGFERFLSILNKGVDMDFLSRIVNDDSVDLPLGEEHLNLQPPAAENNSDTTFRRESQQSDSGVSLLCSSQTKSGERKTDLSSQERSLSDRLSLPDDYDDDDETKNDRSRSKSPSAVKKKKEEEKSKSQVDEQREQLQNILKTLGMSLDLEEMSKLADRTQERLYGKKHENTRVEQENQQRASQKPHRMSSSSSSSASLSRSTSRSHSSSPSRRQCSHSRESRPRSQRGHSRDTSGGGLTCHDANEDSKEERTYSNKDKEYHKVIASYQHPYPPNHTYPQPAAHSAFADNILSQDSQYSAYDSGTYSAASNSYWASTQGAIPPSFYPSGCPYSQNTYHNVSGFAVAPNMDYRPQRNSFGTHNNLLVNPDLSKSEGQTGSISGNRYLEVVRTGRSRCIQTLTKGQKRRGKLETRLKRRHSLKRKRAARKLKQELKNGVAPRLNKGDPKANSVKKGEDPQLNDDDPEAEQSKEEKRPPTDVEIKENLRKKLEAFNQKVKQKVTQPANSLPS